MSGGGTSSGQSAVEVYNGLAELLHISTAIAVGKQTNDIAVSDLDTTCKSS